MSDLLDMFAATAERLFADQIEPKVIVASEEGGLDTALWASVSDAGLPLAAVPESAGGAGGALTDALALAQLSGAHSVPLPLAETLLAAALATQHGLAYDGQPLTLAPARPGEAVQATADGDGLTLTGSLNNIPWAGVADILVRAEGPDGPVLAAVPADAVSVRDSRNLSGEIRGRIDLDGTRVSAGSWAKADGVALLPGHALLALVRVQQMAGALRALRDMSVTYASERKQFGRAISKFQAVQHNLAQLAEEAAAATVAADFAAAYCGSADGLRVIASAKSRVGEAASKGAAIAHQVHGAIGFTREYALQFLTRRLWCWRDEAGAEPYWQEQLGQYVASQGGDGLWPAVTSIGQP